MSVKKYLEILDRFDINFFITDNSLIKDNLSNSFKEELLEQILQIKNFIFLRKSHKEHKMKKDVALILLLLDQPEKKKL